MKGIAAEFCVGWRIKMGRKLIPALVIGLSALVLPLQAYSTGNLENPANGSSQSGIGLFSGWVCDAQEIQIIIDDRPPKIAAYGTARNDTVGACGDSDNGFGLLWNYNLLGAGPHTVRALADGVEFGRADFTVDLLDSSFVRGLDSWIEIIVPELGKEATLVWQDSIQGYTITDVQDMGYTLEDLFGAIQGHWAGRWFEDMSVSYSGYAYMTFEPVQLPEGSTLQVTDIGLTFTGCGEESVTSHLIVNINEPLFEATMTDGSMVEFEISSTDSFSLLTGTFLFTSGPCEGTEGAFIMQKQR